MSIEQVVGDSRFSKVEELLQLTEVQRGITLLPSIAPAKRNVRLCS